SVLSLIPGGVGEPLTWPNEITPARQRPTFILLLNNWERFLDFIKSESERLYRLVNFDALEKLVPEQMHVAHYQNLWQLVQLALAESIDDWRVIGRLDHHSKPFRSLERWLI